MSAGTLIARKSIRARWGRTLAILFAITASVSFVVGSFVLADSLRATFDNLFQELGENVDLEVRAGELVGLAGLVGDARDPIDISIADALQGIDGVEIVEPTIGRFAQLIGPDGDVITPAGGPTLGVSWQGDDGIQGVTVKEGRAPEGPDELAIDKATADNEDLEVGDTVSYLTDVGTFEGTIVGTVGLGSADSFGGAQLVALDLDTALVHFGAGDQVDAIDIALADGADLDRVQAAIAEILPPNTEVVTGEQVAQETADDINQFVDVFGTGLLVFAFITAFVSAFIINNVFQITIGQRLRELALLRAVGATGRQVRWMIGIEAFVLGVLATVLGVFGGLLVARGLIAAFDAAGAGFPDTQTVLQVRTVVIAALVGIGITMASVIVPSRRAALSRRSSVHCRGASGPPGWRAQLRTLSIITACGLPGINRKARPIICIYLASDHVGRASNTASIPGISTPSSARSTLTSTRTPPASKSLNAFSRGLLSVLPLTATDVMPAARNAAAVSSAVSTSVANTRHRLPSANFR